MDRFERILHPTDFSALSTRAGARALALAREFDAGLELLHVIGGKGPRGAVAEEHLARLSLGQDDDLVIERRCVEASRPEVGIVLAARESASDLIVLGTHGRKGFDHVLMGSVAERVVQLAPCAVLTVGPGGAEVGEAARPAQAILCPLDFSEHGRAALDQAVALARRLDARLLLLHVVQPPAWAAVAGATDASAEVVLSAHEAVTNHLDDLVADLGRQGLRATGQIEQGVPWQCIVSLATDQGVDLVVLATHGLSGLRHALLGSTAERVVRACSCPVLTVKVGCFAGVARG